MKYLNVSYLKIGFVIHPEIFNLRNSHNRLGKITSKTLFFVAYIRIVPFGRCEMERSQIFPALCFDVSRST
jgi:hypothetical protein